MIQVQNTPEKLSVVGHAVDDMSQMTEITRDACLTMTVLVKSLMTGITKGCMEHPPMKVSYGKFVLHKQGLSKKSLFLIETFLLTVRELIYQYHGYLMLYDEFGNEVISKEQAEKESVYQPLFPDWRNYIV